MDSEIYEQTVEREQARNLIARLLSLPWNDQ